ncbi:MAG: hypothetical protein ABIJ95_00810 [Pseudomonadota bacterium]
MKTRASTIIGLFLLCLCMASQVQAAGTPVGTTITNQAFANYYDANGNPRPQVASNIIQVLVSQVAAVDVSPPATTKATPKGTTVDYGSIITNMGNGNDTFDLSMTPPVGWTAVIYLDPNHNGIRDPGENTVVSDTGSLPAGGMYWVVVQVTVPGVGVSNGDTFDSTITATSRFNNTVSDSATFTTLVQDAVISVLKSVSPSSGVVPGTVLTYSLEGHNTGSATAQAVKVTDIIPAGTTFVSGSIRIGAVGGTYATATPQTNALDGDKGDYNNSTPGAVTVLWGDSLPGDSGVIWFQVTVNAGVPSTTPISNTAQVDYSVAGVPQPPTDSNPTQVTVGSLPSVSLSSSQAKTGDPGTTLVYPFTACNNGNASDVLALTVNSSLGWIWTIWADVDGNGIPGTGADAVVTDTGSLAQYACRNFLAVVTIPAGLADQTFDTTTVTGTSGIDNNVKSIITLTTTVNAPLLSVTKTVLPAGPQPPGTVLTFTVTVTNSGHGAATGILITDPLPQYTTYKAGSLMTGPNAGSLTGRSETMDGDGAGFDSGIVAAPDGGPLSLGYLGQWVLRFQVTID